MSERQPIRRALVSVYDKSGLDQLAKALINAQVEVVSTGSTAKELASHGVTVTEVTGVLRRTCQDSAPEGARRDPR